MTLSSWAYFLLFVIRFVLLTIWETCSMQRKYSYTNQRSTLTQYSNESNLMAVRVEFNAIFDFMIEKKNEYYIHSFILKHTLIQRVICSFFSLKFDAIFILKILLIWNSHKSSWIRAVHSAEFLNSTGPNAGNSFEMRN